MWSGGTAKRFYKTIRLAASSRGGDKEVLRSSYFPFSGKDPPSRNQPLEGVIP
jgi:hypothetical protein